MAGFKVSFLPSRKKVAAKRGQTILEVARRHRVLIDSSCNGRGTCGRCRVVAKENVSPPQKAERELLSEKEISKGVRLACQARLQGDVRVRVLRTSAFSLAILEKGIVTKVRHRPHIKKLFVRVPEPRLANGQRSDLERLRSSLPAKLSTAPMDIDLLRKLPLMLRRAGNKLTCVFAGERLIGLEEGDTRGRLFGLAVDVGTTTVVASLIDLNRGAVLGVASQLNPQFSYGEDVISRIHYVRSNPGGLEQLRGEIVAAINDLASGLCYETRVKPSEIYELTAAGNSCMIHLLLGVDPSSLALSPYVPVFREGLSVEAAKLRIGAAPGAQVYIPPSASAYVGADITAGILATGLYRKKRPCLLIDVGTNGEVVLVRDRRLTACSTAAGPAFEGMNISCSMRAEPGAIEEVRFVGSEINYKTVNQVAPRGLCGSGLVDLIAELRKRGFIDARGRLRGRAEVQNVGSDPLADRLRRLRGMNGFSVVRKGEGGSAREIYITQGDIRKLQLAKGAIYTGIMLLLQETKLLPEEVSQVLIAGGFGYHLRPESLVEIGLVPPEFIDKIVFAGNSASSGARMLLLDEGSRKKVEHFTSSINCLELTVHPRFEKMYINSLNFE